MVEGLSDAIIAQRDYLSDLDGSIGDGDHGVNMAKGFALAREALSDDMDISAALRSLGSTLLEQVGGSMGPLYGAFFRAAARAARSADRIERDTLLAMLQAGRDAVVEIGGAKPGDKTLLDTLCPAIDALQGAIDAGQTLPAALDALRAGAAVGKENTRGMVAKIGRASRLGDRSRGVLDPGAASCFVLLDALATALAAAIDD